MPPLPGARLTILAGDRTVVYRLIHNLAVDGEAVASDAVGGSLAGLVVGSLRGHARAGPGRPGA